MTTRGTTTRDELVATARAHLDQHGLEGLTLREIARQAGVSHGAPLRHFPSLASLCSAVATQGFRELYAAVDAASTAAGDDPAARLEAAGHAYVSHAVANPGPYTLMFRPDRCDPDDRELAEAGEAAFTQLLDEVAAVQAVGWHPDAATADLAGVIWATAHGIATLTVQGSLAHAVGSHGGNPDQTHLTQLAQDLLSGLVPTGETR